MSEVLEVVAGKVTDEADAIRSFELVRTDGGILPPFSAGAHIEVHLPNGLIRQYSLVNDDRERHRYVIAVLRDEAGRGGSRYMHDVVEPGLALTVKAPRNAFPMEETLEPVALIAGGIGVTPLLAMARSLEAKGKAFILHFATKSRSRTPFVDELSSSTFADRVTFHHTDGPPEQRFDADEVVRSLKPGTHIYLCGPTRFMDAVIGAAQSRDDVVVHKEYFSGTPGEEAPDGEEFNLVLARSGLEATVPSDKTIIQVLEENRVDWPVNCEQGMCGTCLTRVVSGDIDHRDYYLSPGDHERGDQMLVCVSRGKGGTKLVLDL